MIIFTPNTLIKSTEVNANFTESLDVTAHNNPYKASARVSATQNINDITITIIAFDTEEFDTNNNFNNTAGNYDYTAPVTGYYQVNCNAGIFDTGEKYVAANLYVYKNGTSIRVYTQNPYPAVVTATGFSYFYSELLYLVTGDKIQFRASIDTSDNTTGQISNSTCCSFYFVCK